MYANLPLRYKLLVINLVTGGLAFFSVSLLIVLHQFHAGRAAMLEDFRTQASIVGDNSVAALMFKDAATARQILDSLQKSPTVANAVLYDAGAQVFARFSRPDAALEEPPPGLEALRPLPGCAQFTWRALNLCHPILFKGEPQGHLQIQADLSGLYSNLASSVGVSMLAVFLSLSAAFLLLNRMQLSITLPLMDLTATMGQVGRLRDYGRRARVRSQDEIGQLAEGFNAMLAQIQKTDEELKQELRERLQAEMHLERLAHYDATTGLPNRHYFNRQIALQVESALAQGACLGLMFIDLDNFKFVNDTLGHQVGDDLLCLTGERISAVLRRGDTLCRLGGDEFAVILKDIAGPPDAGLVAQKIIDTLTAPMLLSGHDVYIGASIGIAICPEHAAEPEALLRGADTAMYHAKSKGKNNHQYFRREMEGKAQRRLTLETSLRKAVEKNELVLHYQPQFDVVARKVIGLEALLRWNHPQLGLLAPAEFIPLAEETGLIIPMGEWAMETACRQVRQWQQEGMALTLALNVSGRQIREEKFAERVAEILRRTGFDARCLELELTETVFMNHAKLVHQLGLLSRLGLALVIDDFGTGQSSMSYLKRLPIAKLKIDRSFVKDLPHNHDDLEITKAIIAIAQNLRMRLVAEGVETQAQMECLRDNGCPIIQGHFISHPVEARQIMDGWLRRGG